MTYPNLNEPATQANLARVLGVARSTIHGHHEAGVFSPGETLGVWLMEYINKLRAEAAGRVEGDDALRTATIREKLAKTRKTELDIARDEGQLVMMEDVQRELAPLIHHIKTTLEAAGNRIATALSAQYGIPIDKRLMENEFRTALSAIADYQAVSEEAD